MKKSLLLMSLLLLTMAVSAQTKSRVIEDGGTGPYKAIMTEVDGLKAHTIIAPQDLSPFNVQHPLPVLVWGNGACANSPFEHVKFLSEIASYGYLVVATGYIPMTDEWYKGPMSTTQQQIEGIDWVYAQNGDPKSPYYQRVDVSHLCLAGMSCGGLQTLYNCADKRVSALMICNSGLFNQQNAHEAVGGMPMPSKEKLKDIHTPVLYMLGGEPDIAYQNGMDDFHRISHVPAYAANLPVGHGGTYAQPHGGEFAVVARAWLDWQLKGDGNAARQFTGAVPLLSQREGWTLERNDIAQEEAPSTEFVMQLHVTLGEAYTVGDTPHGRRTVIPITGGTFEGPLLRGNILNGGADWQLAKGGRTELEAIYSIVTDDGVYIHIRNRGIISTDKDMNGQPSFYFKTAPQFEAPEDSRYAWLNNSLFLCTPSFPKKGDFKGIVLNVWRVK